MLHKLLACAIRQPPSKAENLCRRQSVAVPPLLRHGQNALDTPMTLVGNCGLIGTLPPQVPRGRHDPTKFSQLARVPFPRTPCPEPEVFPSLHAVIPAGDDTPFKTLEVVGVVVVGGVLD